MVRSCVGLKRQEWRLTELFDFADVGDTAGVFNPDKMLWVNHEWLRDFTDEELAGQALPFFRAAGLPAEDDGKLRHIVRIARERAKTLAEIAQQFRYFYAPVELDPKAGQKFLVPDARSLDFGDSGKQGHADRGGGLVEGDCALAPCRSGRALDQAISKIRLSVLEEAKRLPNGFRFLHDQLARFQDVTDNLAPLAPRSGIATRGHPHDLCQHDKSDKAGIGLAALALDKGRGPSRLDRIILGDVANKHIGVNPDQRPAPRRRIAFFMLSIDTGFAGLRRSPLRARTSATAGRMQNSPFAASTNSIRVPASRFKRSRTSSGMVICPLLVSVAVAIESPY